MQLSEPPIEPTVTGYTVADLATRWKIGPDKIRTWINSGTLAAVNVATVVCGRPLWRITPEAVAAFEAGRRSGPTPKPQQRRRMAAVVDYYPD